jgi:hypothetical protein
MREYQPQWIVSEKATNPTQDGTDSTDSFRASEHTVSAVSAPSEQNRDIFSQPAASGGVTSVSTAALGLDPAPCWVHVCQGPVAESTPPVGWTGVAPTGCGVPNACRTLGPCPHLLERGHCWKERS